MKRLKYFALAALVAFAACDEGDEVVVPDPVTGTITGVVQIDGAGASGVTVTLSSGTSVTTSASGTYTFSDVPEGAYTVTISGAPSDVIFPFTSASAVIAATGQVVTVNFNGSQIRNSSITAAVSVAGGGINISGAVVSLSGAATATETTGTSGAVTFNGLPAGDYTVSVQLSAADAALYDFAQPSQDVTVAAGEGAVLAFVVTPKTISTIRGTLFIDALPNNDIFEPSAEEAVAAANIELVVEGVSVGVFDTIQTAADGTFELTNLPAANYRVALNTTDSNIPGALAFGGTNNAPVVMLGVADTEVVNFPFDIIEQKVTVGAFLGIDGTPSARTTPLPGADIRIYPTEALASAFAGGFIGTGTTDETGEVTIDFDRGDDFQPGNPDLSDNIVFAAITTPLPNLVQNGEIIIEIPFESQDSLTIALDEFDYTASQYTIAWKIQEGDGDTYEDIPLRALADTTITPAISGLRSDADGFVYLTATTDLYAQTRPTNWAPFSNENIPLPPPTRMFEESFVPDQGEVRGGYLFYDFNGLALPTDTIFVGTANLYWPEVDVFGRVFREFNEEVGYQAGEDPFGSPIDQARVVLESDQGGVWTPIDSVDGGAPGPGAISNVSGQFVFRLLSPDSTYRFVGSTNAAAVPSNWAILDEQVLEAPQIDGFDQAVYLCPLQDAGTTTFANCGTYAVKAQSNRVTGFILYRDGSPVPDGTEVRISVNADSTVQGRASSIGDTIVTTSGGTGFFQSNPSIREGFYKVTPLTDEPAVFFNPTTNGEPKDFESRGATQVDIIPIVPGFNTVADASFHAHRADGTIRGYVVNDRDEDGNIIDVDEGLVGATVTLYADDGLGSITTSADSIVATATIGEQGLFEFENLITRRYIIEAEAPGTEVILSDGSLSETQYAVTPDNLDIDINPEPTAALPFWDFETSSIVNTGEAGEQASYFTFLFTDGVLGGTVINDEDDSPVSSMSIQITRCDNYGAPLPLIPALGDCTDNGGTGAAGTFEQGFSDNEGFYFFTNLREGVYQVTIQSASGGDADGAFDGTLTTGNGLAGETFVIFVDGRSDFEEILFRVDNP